MHVGMATGPWEAALSWSDAADSSQTQPPGLYHQQGARECSSLVTQAVQCVVDSDSYTRE